MNLLTATQNNLIEAMQHYFCLRLKFRGTVLQDSGESAQLLALPGCASKANETRH